MANTDIFRDDTKDATANYPATPSSQLIEGTFHVLGDFDSAVISGKCKVGTDESFGLKFTHEDRAPKNVKIVCDQFVFTINGGSAKTKLTLVFSNI